MAQTRMTEDEWQEMQRFLNGAIRAGKFPPSRREAYERMYRADKKGTRALVSKLATGIPHDPEAGEAYPSSWLSSNERARAQAAGQAPQPQPSAPTQPAEPQAGEDAYPSEWLGPRAQAQGGEPGPIAHEIAPGSPDARAGTDA